MGRVMISMVGRVMISIVGNVKRNVQVSDLDEHRYVVGTCEMRFNVVKPG